MCEKEGTCTTKGVLLEQYRIYLGDLWNTSKWQEGTRKFYVSLVGIILTFLAMAGREGPLKGITVAFQGLVGLVGIAICVVWFINARSFPALFCAKFKVIETLECKLAFKVYALQSDLLRDKQRHTYLPTVELGIPIIFAVVFIAILVLMVLNR